MSLNYDATKCDEAWLELEPETREALIFGCMVTNLGSITKANHKEWYARYVMYNRVKGYADPYLKLSDVKAAIGLGTNVSDMTNAQFKNWLYPILVRDVDELVRGLALELESTNG